MAGKTEDAAVAQMMAVRFIDLKQLWKGKRDSSVTSAWELVRQTVELRHSYGGMALGIAAFSRRLGLVDGIGKRWGRDWYSRMPRETRHPSWLVAEDMPEATLHQVLAVAEQGVTFEGAIALWKESIANRLDFGIRRELNIKAPATEHLLSSDVDPKRASTRVSAAYRATSKGSAANGATERTAEGDVQIDGSLQLRLVRGDGASGGKRPLASEDTGIPRPGKKQRKRGTSKSDSAVRQMRLDEGDDVAGSWQLTQGGKHETRRQGFTRVTRDAPTQARGLDGSQGLAGSTEQADNGDSDGEAEREVEGEEGDANDSTTEQEGESFQPASTWTNGMCESPSLLLTFVRMNEVVQEILPREGDYMGASGKCCGRCKLMVDRAMAKWMENFLPLISVLQAKGREHRR